MENSLQKNVISPDISIPLMESFYTLQGEGYHQGKAAYFIRLGGCDVGCVWCDVKESWDAAKHPMKHVEEIISELSNIPSCIVVITGGEPLLYELGYLTEALREKGFKTHLETSGSSPLSGKWDWICLSPKKFKAPLESVLVAANELKIIVYNQSDFKWAEQYAARVHSSCLLYLQPEWSKSQSITPLIVDYIKHHPQWSLSLQTHKYIDVP
jgi:organic radical activating enzyme